MTALEIFRLVASEFAEKDDDAVKQWLDLTAPLVSKKRFGKKYEQALALLTAHRMKLFGQGKDAFGSIGDSMAVSSYSEGGVSVSFAASQSGNTATDAELALTVYGVNYLTLRKNTIIPITVSGG